MNSRTAIRLAAAVVFAASGALLMRQREKEPAARELPAPVTLKVPSILSQGDMSNLRAWTQDPDPAVRWAAVEALHGLRDPLAVEVLKRMLARDDDAELRAKAASLLKAQPGEDTLKILAAGLGDRDKDVRIAALAALGASGDPAAGPLATQGLQDPEPEVRAEAIRALDLLQEKHAARFTALKEQLRQDYKQAAQKYKNGESYGTGNKRDQ